jgi:hypothetical protein
MIANNSLIGKRVNNVTIVEVDNSKPHGKGVEIRFLCKCDCGKIFSCVKSSLVHEKVNSCGCKKKMRYDILGERFDRLLVVEKIGLSNHKELMWKCICDCGKETVVNSYALRNGTTRSCGCLCFESRGNHLLLNWKKIHYARTNMLTRCYNKNFSLYSRYGGRGITVCEEWRNNSLLFYNWSISNGFSKELTLDRINNDGNYEPSNCRWVNMQVQSNNRHTNRFLTRNGETHTMAEWSRILETPYQRIQTHIYSGKDFESYEV